MVALAAKPAIALLVAEQILCAPPSQALELY